MTITYIGSSLAISAGAPATSDRTGYVAKSYQAIGKIISIAEIGDTSEDVTIDLLQGGRRKHVNGVADIGDIVIGAEFDWDDDGQEIVRPNANSNTTYSFRVRDEDGMDVYFHGVVANYRETERNANSYKGCMFTLRGQSAILRQRPRSILFRHGDPFEVPEGATGNNRRAFWVKLGAPPTANVVVTPTGQAGTDLSLAPASRTYTPTNWNEYQRFQVGSTSDGDSTDDEVAITFTPSNTGGYAPSMARTIVFKIIDDD